MTATAHRTIDLTTDRTGRTLHLVDLENLSGGPSRPADEHARSWRAYEDAAGIAVGDQVVVAASGRTMRDAVWFLPTGIASRSANGADGADRVLLEVGDAAWIASRFDRLVIGSGDHAFAELADAVQALGVEVEVVVGVGWCSSLYRRAGHTVRHLRHDDLALAV